ncbi:hypothetical protein MRX96_053317, partial [Rhipicephalus microplus]
MSAPAGSKPSPEGGEAEQVVQVSEQQGQPQEILGDGKVRAARNIVVRKDPGRKDSKSKDS